MNNDRYNATKPFLAIVLPTSENKSGFFEGDFEKNIRVYVINPTDNALANLVTSVSGFMSTDDGVITADGGTPKHFERGPQAAVLIERSSQDDFDEMVCSWYIMYDVAGTTTAFGFSAGKRLANTIAVELIPILLQPGLLVSR
jgi:hypothetical protein